MTEKQRRKPHPTAKQIAEARRLFEDDEMSRLEVSKTTGISIYFLRLYLPDGKWTKVEAGKFAVIRKKENRISDRIQK